jgi:hypothetical protein
VLFESCKTTRSGRENLWKLGITHCNFCQYAERSGFSSIVLLSAHRLGNTACPASPRVVCRPTQRRRVRLSRDIRRSPWARRTAVSKTSGQSAQRKSYGRACGMTLNNNTSERNVYTSYGEHRRRKQEESWE